MRSRSQATLLWCREEGDSGTRDQRRHASSGRTSGIRRADSKRLTQVRPSTTGLHRVIPADRDRANQIMRRQSEPLLLVAQSRSVWPTPQPGVFEQCGRVWRAPLRNGGLPAGSPRCSGPPASADCAHPGFWSSGLNLIERRLERAEATAAEVDASRNRRARRAPRRPPGLARARPSGRRRRRRGSTPRRPDR